MVEALGLFQVRNHTAGSSVFSCCRPNDQCINCVLMSPLPLCLQDTDHWLALVTPEPDQVSHGSGLTSFLPSRPFCGVAVCRHTLVVSVMVQNLLTNSLLHTYISLDVYTKRIKCSCGVTGLVLMLLCPGSCWPIP